MFLHSFEIPAAIVHRQIMLKKCARRLQDRKIRYDVMKMYVIECSHIIYRSSVPSSM